MLDVHCPIYTGARIFFAQPDALRGSLGITLKVQHTDRQMMDIRNRGIKVEGQDDSTLEGLEGTGKGGGKEGEGYGH